MGTAAPHVCGPQLSGSTLCVPSGKGVSESMSICAPRVLCIRDSYILGPLLDPSVMILVKQIEVGGSQNLWEASWSDGPPPPTRTGKSIFPASQGQKKHNKQTNKYPHQNQERLSPGSYFLLYPKFLLYLLRSLDFLDQIVLQSPGSTMASSVITTHPRGEVSKRKYVLFEQGQGEARRRAIVWFWVD